MYSCSSYGPRFGAGHDIYISNNALSNSASYTRCGYTYSVPTGYSVGNCGFFTGGYQFTPTDIEVFYEIGNKFVFLSWVDVIFARVFRLKFDIMHSVL